MLVSYQQHRRGNKSDLEAELDNGKLSKKCLGTVLLA